MVTTTRNPSLCLIDCGEICRSRTYAECLQIFIFTEIIVFVLILLTAHKNVGIAMKEKIQRI